MASTILEEERVVVPIPVREMRTIRLNLYFHSSAKKSS